MYLGTKYSLVCSKHNGQVRVIGISVISNITFFSNIFYSLKIFMHLCTILWSIDYHCLRIHHSCLDSSTDSVSKDGPIPHSTLGHRLRIVPQNHQSGSREPWSKSQPPLPRCMTLFQLDSLVQFLFPCLPVKWGPFSACKMGTIKQMCYIEHSAACPAQREHTKEMFVPIAITHD